MNIVSQLLLEYFKEEKTITVGLVVMSLLVSIIQANGISYINAAIIGAIETQQWGEAHKYFGFFAIICAVFLIVNYFYKMLQTKLLTKLRQWIRYRLISILLASNNENMTEMNYTRISSPINRISSVCFMLFTDIFSGMLPSISFAIIIGIYLLIFNWQLGALFAVGNAIIFALIGLNWNRLFDKNNEYEKYTIENEGYLLEILNNIDKIVYRGQVNAETNVFHTKTKQAIDKALEFYRSLENNGLMLNTTVSLVVVGCVWFALKQVIEKKITPTFFISFMTMLLLYRDKMISFIQMVPDFIEFLGRTKSVLKHFKDFDSTITSLSPKYKTVDVQFTQIQFKNVSFKYKESETAALTNFNITLNTSGNKIIGIVGLSGNGKSTLIKLLLKLHECQDGEIYINGESIKDIDPNYIRHHVTYVSQTGKLFDRKVIENIMYGCSVSEECNKQLEEIMKYPKIRELYKNIDIFNKQSGALGENLSGGQRQVINIIGGLINPSKILILDEPTNALDAELKQEVIKIIREFRKNKNAIIVITHDKDVYTLFNEKVSV